MLAGLVMGISANHASFLPKPQIPLEPGKSGRITLTADDKFFVGKKYKWQYVQAIVNVQKKQLGFYWMAN